MQVDPLALVVHDLILLAIAAVVAWIISYARQKGRNLATKEDVAEITDKVEGVRREHESELERLRIELAKTVHVHRAQVELELKAYQAVWSELVSARKATQGLRRPIDSEPEDEEERWRERLERFTDAFERFRDARDRWRPFYPQPVFEHLERLAKTYHEEWADFFVYGRPGAQEPEGYWERAFENMDTMATQIDEACEAIRERIRSLTVIQT